MIMPMSVFTVLLISGLFTLIFLGLSEKKGSDREKCSPYECGFEAIGGARSSFSVRFFLLGVLFVVFDVEVVLLIPLIYMMVGYKSIWGVGSCWFFLFVLFVGLIHEYREGSLDWIK
uniref:NADH-ubiquinone oxidoreductase chain 3 n=1 Tax=Mytilus californianus TaxID=6549 RepID=J9RAV0_MYTCA|nr:NADH dehydrogenase subunit 3 [Mytilus californianus]